MAKHYEMSDFMPLKNWISAGRGGEQFDSEDKVGWILRTHRKDLIKAGELIPGRGSRPTLVGPRFGILMLDILRRESGHAG